METSKSLISRPYDSKPEAPQHLTEIENDINLFKSSAENTCSDYIMVLFY